VPPPWVNCMRNAFGAQVQVHQPKRARSPLVRDDGLRLCQNGSDKASSVEFPSELGTRPLSGVIGSYPPGPGDGGGPRARKDRRRGLPDSSRNDSATSASWEPVPDYGMLCNDKLSLRAQG